MLTLRPYGACSFYSATTINMALLTELGELPTAAWLPASLLLQYASRPACGGASTLKPTPGGEA